MLHNRSAKLTSFNAIFITAWLTLFSDGYLPETVYTLIAVPYAWRYVVLFVQIKGINNNVDILVI